MDPPHVWLLGECCRPKGRQASVRSMVLDRAWHRSCRSHDVSTSRSHSLGDPSKHPATKTSEQMRPWKAPALQNEDVDLANLTYVVVDEIVDDLVGLSLSPWPKADPKGRLRFGIEGDPVHVGVELHDLCTFLTNERRMEFVPVSRTPTEHPKRELRIGTVLAIEVKNPGSSEWKASLDQHVGRVFDITADAREVAKLAYYGAMTEQWDHRHAEQLGLVPQSS
jgi:hypothetical protein